MPRDVVRARHALEELQDHGIELRAAATSPWTIRERMRETARSPQRAEPLATASSLSDAAGNAWNTGS